MRMSDDLNAHRPTGEAMRRGALRRCPNCGEGALFQGYLKIRDTCPNCGEELHHQRADDGPAYITILVVSHLLAPLLLWIFIAWRPEPVPLLIGFSLAAVVLSLVLLPVFKGAMVGMQWARRMHGFGDEHEQSAA
ncbi:MAG: DUF983 domain-containing protein [Paracoccus sp. (in: a-proteobacteria)]|nr:DUF983 domain-containing protein [Paracoccus sp. (in: a-proteobacteria)]